MVQKLLGVGIAADDQSVIISDSSGVEKGVQSNPLIIKQSTVDANNSQPVVLRDSLGAAKGEGNNPLLLSTTQNRFRDDFYNNTLNTSKWATPVVGSGMAVDVVTLTGSASSGLRFQTGTTVAADSYVLSQQTFQVPFRCQFGLYLSQRIANQDFYIEFVSVDSNGVPDEKSIIGWDFNGTTATQGIYRSGSDGTIVSSALSTITTTAGSGNFEIESFTDESRFHTGAQNSSAVRAASFRNVRYAADPNSTYKLRIRAKNGSTAPASTTTMYINYVVIDDHVEIAAELISGRGNATASDSLPVNISASNATVSVSGSATVTPVAVTTNVETTTVVAVNTAYAGGSKDSGSGTSAYKDFIATACADKTGTLFIQGSTDASTWRFLCKADMQAIMDPILGTSVYSVTLAQELSGFRYYRAYYINGAGTQTFFALTTRFRSF